MPNLRHAGHNRGSLEIAAYCRQGAQAPFRANDSSSCRPSPFTPLLSAGPPIGIASLSAATIPSPSIGVHRVMAMHRGTAEAHLRGRLWEPRYNRGAPETRDLAVYSAPGRAGGNGCCRSAFLGCAGGGFRGRRARHQFLTLIGRRRHATLRIGERSRVRRNGRTANSYRLSQLAQKMGRANFLPNRGPDALTQCEKCGLTPRRAQCAFREAGEPQIRVAVRSVFR